MSWACYILFSFSVLNIYIGYHTNVILFMAFSIVTYFLLEVKSWTL